jgi:uncharacterized protein YndB with AHSA1/START domain
MKIVTIKKTIEISSSREKVYEVLISDKYIPVWYEAFSKGSRAETDWKVGSKAVFTDDGVSGLVGRIVVNDPNKEISIEYDGLLANGKEEYESEMAKNFKGARETYRLSGDNGTTRLDVECDMGDEYADQMSAMWENALQKIRELSEGELVNS